MASETTPKDVLRAMGEQLEAYIESDAAFRPIVIETEHGTRNATLTLGIALQAIATGDDDTIASLGAAIEAVRADHPERWSEKVLKELRGAANLWCGFVDDIERGDGGGSWRTEAFRRTRAQRLLDDAERHGVDVPSERARIADCDDRARRLVGEGPFMLDADQEAAHPRDVHWWLYSVVGG